MEDTEDKKMPLLDHLIELRQRLIYSVIGLIAVFFICFYFAGDLFSFLTQPLVNVWIANGDLTDHRFIFTALQEKFFTDIKIAFFAALFLAFPLIASQLWMFVAPGLYKNEKRAFLPFLAATPFLFFAGAAFVYYVVMPVAWKFFYEYGVDPGGVDTAKIELEARVADYLALSMRLIFAFGISFELPVVLTLLARAGFLRDIDNQRPDG
jgi:sec-independent protein translocase protein TatC